MSKNLSRCDNNCRGNTEFHILMRCACKYYGEMSPIYFHIVQQKWKSVHQEGDAYTT